MDVIDGTPRAGFEIDAASVCRSHVLARIDEAALDVHPFGHVYIEGVFPAGFYAALHGHMRRFKHSDLGSDRHQDNPAFTNRRYSLYESTDEVVEVLRAVFSDTEVKRALLGKFYRAPVDDIADGLTIHEEFEYVFTKAGRFQNIHVDIPPKYLSFVFYMPEHPASPVDELHNGTILYDKSLQPHYPAAFKANSVCIFAPHFSSYHGFSSTIDRDALVMFYVDKASLQEWQQMRQRRSEEPPFGDLLDAIERKVRRFSLIEYAGGEERLRTERSACRVNAPQGRVLRDLTPPAT